MNTRTYSAGAVAPHPTRLGAVGPPASQNGSATLVLISFSTTLLRT